MTIRTKLFLAFVGIASAPFLIVFSLVLWLNGREMERGFADTADRTARQAALSLDALIEPANRALGILSSSRVVAELSRKSSAIYQDNLGEWYIDALEIRAIMRSVVGTTPMIADLYVVMTDGLAGFSESPDFLHLARSSADRWRVAMDEKPSELLWFSQEDFSITTRRDALSGMARVRDPDNLLSTVAFARADVPLSAFRAVLENSELSENAFALLSDSEGRVVTLSARGKPPSERTLAAITGENDHSEDSSAGDGYSADRAFGDERLLIASRPLAAPGWTFTLAVPYSDVMQSANRARSRTLLVFSLIVPLLFPAAWLLARSSTRRIRSLRDRLSLVGSGHPRTRTEDESDDEIGELSRRFNEMTLRIEALLKEEYELGRRVNELELRVLQAQIDPHFLYNTLDMINCLALARGVPEISEAVAALARFYRASLAGGADSVTLGSELDHVRGYVAVENLRFEGSIELKIDVPEELASVLLPKLTLQPLVENAVHHGILEKEEERGTVQIEAFAADGFLTLNVLDDGVGLRELSDGEIQGRGSRGFGVRNIRDRLTLAFGEGAALTLSKQRSGGCVATIRVPLEIDKGK